MTGYVESGQESNKTFIRPSIAQVQLTFFRNVHGHYYIGMSKIGDKQAKKNLLVNQRKVAWELHHWTSRSGFIFQLSLQTLERKLNNLEIGSYSISMLY